MLWSLTFERHLFGLITKTYRQANRVILREVKQFCYEMGIPLRQGKGYDRNTFTIGSNEYMLLSGPDVRAASTIQSYTFTGVYVDEVVNIAEPVVKEIENRVRGHKRVKMWMTANPGNPAHWFKRQYVDQAQDKGYAHCQAPLRGQPDDDSGVSCDGWLPARAGYSRAGTSVNGTLFSGACTKRSCHRLHRLNTRMLCLGTCR